MRDLLEQINNKKAAARVLADEKKTVEAKTMIEEIKSLQEEFDIEAALYEEEKEKVENKLIEKPVEKNEVKDFIDAVRTKFRNAMSEGSSTNGGYTVPQDIQTQINELKQAKDSLQNLVKVESVTTLSGSRVFKSRGQWAGFAEVAENGEIAEKATPQFTNLAYAVKKYAGFMKVTNELLKDSDAAIRDTIVRWIGDESRVTRNKLILAELDKKAKTAIADTDDIKDIVNVQIDPAFQMNCKMVTNQDGYNWLDKQKDGEGRYLLQPSISSPTGKQAFGCDIVVISNKDLPTVAGKAPIICGDLEEAIVVFDRQSTEIVASDVAADAYLTDVTLFRAIERLEVKTRDAEAFVYGQVTIA